MILLLMPIQMILALQISPLTEKGYFEEPLGSLKILDHFHSFIFSFNISDLESSYITLRSNLHFISSRGNEINQVDRLTFKTFQKLISNLDQVKQVLDKLNYNRSKRGLVNGLGSIIKFITGNLDDTDLQVINNNLDKLFENQKATISKINEVTSLANHITNRIADQTDLLNKNVEATTRLIQKIENRTEIILLIQNEVYQSENLLNTLQIIERTLSMSMYQFSNLEIITRDEILEMHDYLEKLYNPKQLLPFDSTHLFKLLKSTKMSAIGVNQTIAFVLKIPILKPSFANYSNIYPIPNSHDLFFIPPFKHLIRINQDEFWTNEDCEEIDTMYLCMEPPVQIPCTTHELKECTSAKANNKFKIIHVLKNRQLLTVFKESIQITEDCNGILTQQQVQGANLLSSPCRVFIGALSFSNTIPAFNISMPNITTILKENQFQVDLNIHHFSSPKDLQREATQIKPIFLEKLSKTVHYSITSVFSVIVIVFIITLIVFRKRILELFWKPRTILHLSTGQPNEDVPQS